MKITAKTTKEAMKEFLKDNLAVVKGDLKDRVKYALKASDDKLTRKDLVDLVKEVTALVEEAPAKKTETKAKPKAENSLKKPAKKEAPKAEPEEEEAPAKAEKKPAKKGEKSKVKSSTASKNSIEYAEMFPETLEGIELEGKARNFELAKGIETMDDLYDAIMESEEKGEVLLFAFYWNKRSLRQFSYFDGILGQPKSFKDDLDLAMAIYCSEERRIAYAVSTTTEAPYSILPEDLVEEDGIRISTGTEFQIYREISEEE